MGAGELLTTLDRVKTWLGIPLTNTEADDLLNSMIRAASAFVLKYLNRKGLALTEVSEIYNGYGNSFMTLRNVPVYDIVALSIHGTPITPAQGDGFSAPFSSGYVLDDRKLMLFGRNFPRALASIAVKYRSGYVVQGEEHIVPPDPYTVETDLTWLSDLSVSLATGHALTKVASDPVDGEYSVKDGTYTFNSAQEGETVLITYSGVPADIEQAVWEMVGERYKYKDRIGYASKSLGGQETVSFTNSSMTSYIRELLNPHRQVVPV